MYSVVGLRRLVLPRSYREEVISEIGGLPLSTNGINLVFLSDLPERLKRYFNGEQVDFYDSLDLSGFSKFQQEVWNEVRNIPYGKTRSYKWIAERIGQPQAVRAVGQALGRNPVPIVIPCHRVIRSDGNMGGFRGGLSMKKLLLHMEELHICV